MKSTKNIGNKYETMDGAFTVHALHNKDGWNRKKARRKINKEIRQSFKNESKQLLKNDT